MYLATDSGMSVKIGTNINQKVEENMEPKLSTFIRGVIGSLCVGAAALCASVAKEYPWVEHHAELIGNNYTGEGIGYLPELPRSITAASTRKSIFPIMMGHSVINSDEANIDQQCLQQIANVDDKTFSTALKGIATLYQYGTEGDPSRQVNDFMRRVDFLTHKSFRESAFKGGNFEREKRAVMVVMYRVYFNNYNLSNFEYKQKLDLCFS